MTYVSSKVCLWHVLLYINLIFSLVNSVNLFLVVCLWRVFGTPTLFKYTCKFIVLFWFNLFFSLFNSNHTRIYFVKYSEARILFHAFSAASVEQSEVSVMFHPDLSVLFACTFVGFLFVFVFLVLFFWRGVEFRPLHIRGFYYISTS